MRLCNQIINEVFALNFSWFLKILLEVHSLLWSFHCTVYVNQKLIQKNNKKMRKKVFATRGFKFRFEELISN